MDALLPYEPLEHCINVCYGIRDGRSPLALAIAGVVIGAQVAFEILCNLAAGQSLMSESYFSLLHILKAMIDNVTHCFKQSDFTVR